jgi:hypothetical protein
VFKNTVDNDHVLAGSGGLSCPDRQEILDAHNSARQNVALGRIPGQPAASNMLELVSDTKMADVSGLAQRERERESELASLKGK